MLGNSIVYCDNYELEIEDILKNRGFSLYNTHEFKQQV